MKQAQYTIYDLLTHGFILDSLTWNDYIQQLALRGRLLDAFSAFEMYLVPYFPGWELIKDNFIRQYPIGHKWQAVRKPEMNSHTIMPRYKTIVVLAGALSQVYRDESNGLGYRPEMQAWMSDILKRVAPRTTQVIDAMPRTGDKLQAEYMYNF
jgi:pentatricopeptide repeat-containing protein PET309